MNTFYSCILPVYNESPRVPEIIKTLLNIKDINQIICVDDGSTDDLKVKISKEFSSVELLSHSKNLGKARAIKTGLSKASNDNIILLDSDLINLKADELQKALIKYSLYSLDCLIMYTKSVNLIDKLLKDKINSSLPFEGCRIVKKRIVDKIVSNELKCYQFEAVLNNYLINNNCRVQIMPVSAYSISKAAKENFITGVRKDVIMWKQIISAIGASNFITQIKWIRKVENYSN